jgi:hypothetical protein
MNDTRQPAMNMLRRLGDHAGMLASALCMLHCLALLLAVFPMLGPGHNDGFHEAMVGIALLAALVALAPGYAAHRQATVALAGAAGVACLALAAFAVGPRYGEAAETWLTIAGAGLLCLAHLRNRACCGRCTGTSARRMQR